MEANNNSANSGSTIFSELGKSINRLNEIISSNVLIHYLGKWLSVLFEISLYLFFLAELGFAFYFPTLMTTSYFEYYDFKGSISVSTEELTSLLRGVSILLVLLSLPILFLAILLSRNRKKNNLIREAFIETQKIRSSFDSLSKIIRF